MIKYKYLSGGTLNLQKGFFDLVKHSWNTMGHSYGKLKQFDLLQVHYLAKIFIELDYL